MAGLLTLRLASSINHCGSTSRNTTLKSVFKASHAYLRIFSARATLSKRNNGSGERCHVALNARLSKRLALGDI